MAKRHLPKFVFYMSNVICIGAALVDELYFGKQTFVPHTSNPARIQKSVGGVVANIARHLALSGVSVKIISYLGHDADGHFIEQVIQRSGIDTDLSVKDIYPTGKFTAFVNPDGSLFSAACMDHTDFAITDTILTDRIEIFKQASCIVADCNLNEVSLAWLMSFCNNQNIKLFIETVSISKSQKLKQKNLEGIFMLTPNEDELFALTDLHGEAAVKTLLGKGVKNVWVKKGKEGSVMYSQSGEIHLCAPDIEPIDTTGAGDATLAGWIFGYLQQKDTITSIAYGHALAAGVMLQKGTVMEALNKQMIEQLKQQYYPYVQ